MIIGLSHPLVDCIRPIIIDGIVLLYCKSFSSLAVILIVYCILKQLVGLYALKSQKEA